MVGYRRKNAVAILVFLCVAAVFASCGGGGGGGTPPIAPAEPTQAVVKLSVSGVSVPIGAIDAILQLPSGVTVQTQTNSIETAPGVVVASGQAASGSMLTAVYTAASNTVRVVLISGTSGGISAGEFATVTCSIASGASPSASDFTILSLTAYTLGGATITGASGIASATLVTPSTTNPTRAYVKLTAAGASGQIGAVDLQLVLPAGVSVNATASPPDVNAGVVVASGNALSNSMVTATYDSATGTVRIVLVNPVGFSAGEFATVVCDLVSGTNPSSSDFTVAAVSVKDLNGQAISGASVTAGATVE